MRQDEEYAKQLLLEQLTKYYSRVKVGRGSEPPDYFFDIDGTSYAVEVTRLVQRRQRGERDISRCGEGESFFRWIKQINSEVKQKGLIKGTYVMLHKPASSYFNNKLKRECTKKLSYYLDSTKEESRTEYSILSKKYPCLLIRKLNADGCHISGILDGSKEWSSDIQANAYNILRYAVIKKRFCMRRIMEPSILILINTYVMGDYPNYKRALCEIRDKFFRAIYLINDGKCLALKPLQKVEVEKERCF